jgi:hypothetical protein
MYRCKDVRRHPSPREFEHARKQLLLLLFGLTIHSLALSGGATKEIPQAHVVV